MGSWKYLFLSLLSGVMLCGCTENINNIYIIDDSCTQGKDTSNTGTTGKNGSEILFKAYVESINSTKNISIMHPDVVASIYSYNGNPLNLSEPLKKLNLKALKAGLLSPVNDSLLLPVGSYSFYSVSDNSANLPPEFINGQSVPLQNGVDYLWGRVTAFDLRATFVIVPIYYTHSATQVLIKLSAGNGVILNELLSTEIYPSASGSSMNEYTGIIPQTERYDDKLSAMGIKDFYSQYTMLPIKTGKPMIAYFSVRINNEIQARKFKAEISLPESGLEGGRSYLFNAVVNLNTIVFNQTSIIDWVVVDKTGSPLYPSQI